MKKRRGQRRFLHSALALAQWHSAPSYLLTDLPACTFGVVFVDGSSSVQNNHAGLLNLDTGVGNVELSFLARSNDTKIRVMSN